MAIDSKVTVKIVGDNEAYLKAVAQIRREEARAEKDRDLALAKSLAAQGKLTEEAFKTARAQSEVGGAAGKAVDFVGGKLKAFGSSLVSGAFAGLFAGAIGGSIGSVIQKLLAPPTPEEQLASLQAIEQHKVAFFDFAEAIKYAHDQIKKLGEAETAALMKDKNHQDFLTVQGLEEQYNPDKITLRYKQQLELIDKLHDLDDPARTKARRDAYDAFYGKMKEVGHEFDAQLVARTIGVTEQSRATELGLDKVEKAAKKAGAAVQTIHVDKDLLAWFTDQVSYAGGSASGRKILDEQARERRAFEEDRQQRQVQLAEDFARAEAARSALADKTFHEGVAGYDAKSPLEKIFGSAQEMQALGEAFGGFADAVGASYEAIVTGSEGAAAAFRKFMSGSLLAIGKKAAVQAIYEIALAISEPWDAGRHLLAAAKFGATAVAAGVAASALGGGGGGTTASGGGAAPTGNYLGQYAAGGGGGMVFVYGDSFADDSPRMRQQKAAVLIQRAQRAQGPGTGPDDVRYT